MVAATSLIGGAHGYHGNVNHTHKMFTTNILLKLNVFSVSATEINSTFLTKKSLQEKKSFLEMNEIF